ncbi:MAG: FMN-binding protein [Candidatus Cloacimonetes bacterium]|nr:FMN-binding protein [Candidatus Cloacimonadota bacterium]
MKEIICAVGILLAAFTVFAIDSDISDKDFISLAHSSIKADSITFCTFEDIRFAQYNNEEGNSVFFIISSDFSKPVGYEGFTNVGISLDNAGKVLSVKILSSEDTPSFVKRVKRKWFLNQFIGYSENKNITMITGATKTCKAVKISIEESVEKFVPVIEFINQENDFNKKKISLTKKSKSTIKIIAI